MAMSASMIVQADTNIQHVLLRFYCSDFNSTPTPLHWISRLPLDAVTPPSHIAPIPTPAMNRSSRDSGIGVRNGGPSTHRRGHSNGGVPLSDDNTHLDLFSRTRRSLSVAPSDDSDASLSIKLGRLSTKPPKNVLDDLLSSSDGGKHDYDWLLTPPGTPMFPTSDANHGSEPPTLPSSTRSSSLARSISTSTATKASRLSVSQLSETNNRPRPARSSSLTRPSVSTSQYSSYSNKSSNILNTSSASVSSYIRPSTPTRSSSIATRPSTPSSRPVSSRSSTPSRGRPSPSAASSEKVRPSQNSRPSTPTSRPQVSATSNTLAARSTSRPSTPTRRNSAPPSSLPVSGPSNHSVGISLQNGRAVASTSRPSSPSPRPVASTSRPSSPSPRVRPAPQPIVLPDFSLETPPNLRTTLPDRPLSAGRSRPAAPVSLKGNVENQSAPVPQRRQSSPIVTRGRLVEPTARNKVTANGHTNLNPDSYRAPHGSELSSRKPLRTSADSTGFGRNISKKSLDMAIRHMDIRNGSNGVRPLSGSTLFPQSIRSSNGKGQQHNPPSSGVEAAYNGDGPMNHNGGSAENGNLMSRYLQSGNEEEVKPHDCAKLTMGDMYESSRYDTFLRKEDLKNTNWLHSLDDISDQGSIFDNGFEPLPEPFDPL